MLFCDTILDSYDEDMLPFYESDDYIFQHRTNNRMIETFSATLSPEQQTTFVRILNNLSNEYSNVALSAYACGLEKDHTKETEYGK